MRDPALLISRQWDGIFQIPVSAAHLSKEGSPVVFYLTHDRRLLLSNRNHKLLISRAPTKRCRRNQLIHRRLTKTKLIGSGQDPESQAGRQSDRYGGWCLELRRGGRYGEDDELDLLKSSVFGLE